MPFTYLAHQAPVLPLARSKRGHVDGVALVFGSMAPDAAYVLLGSRFAVDAHAFPAVLAFGVPFTLIVSLLVVRVLAPVVPAHLPDVGPFHLRDYRGLATHRFHWGWSAVWAAAGALSHVVLDAFTNSSGWLPHHARWYRARVLPGVWLHREWTVFRVVQYASHIGLSIVAVLLLARYGRERWMAGRARRVPLPRVSIATHAVLWSMTAIGAVAGLAWGFHERHGYGSSLMRLSAGVFTGMVAGALAAAGAGRSRGHGEHDRVREVVAGSTVELTTARHEA